MLKRLGKTKPYVHYWEHNLVEHTTLTGKEAEEKTRRLVNGVVA